MTSTTDTLCRRLFDTAERLGAAPALAARKHGRWHISSWTWYADEVRRVGKALMALGLESGGAMVIISSNRPEWVIAELGCMSMGGVPAGIYTTSSASEVGYIVGHCEAAVAIVESPELYAKLAEHRARLPKLQHVVVVDNAEAIEDDGVMSWSDFRSLGDGVEDDDLDAKLNALSPAQLATLIYTSGTTGPPKAVMLSHENLVWTADAQAALVRVGPGDRVLSYLPLCHIAEQIFTVLGACSHGLCTYFVRSVADLAAELVDVQPSLFLGVPRVWEKFRDGLEAEMRKQSGLKGWLVDWARNQAAAVHQLRRVGETPSLALAARYALAERAVLRRIKRAIGLGNARYCFTGAAPIEREVLSFFASLDVSILESYGQSENCGGPTAINLPGRSKVGTVGRPIANTEVAIAPDGEILVKGPYVFMGYLNDPEATREALREGWLYSGDLGSFDEDGFLRITGRKKDIIITAGGKNIAPANIESVLKREPLIAEAVVVGDRRKFLAALIALDPEEAEHWAARNAMDVSALGDCDLLRQQIQQALDRANEQLARVAQIKRFAIVPAGFSVERGELTPTLKVKRNVICQRFAGTIDGIYAG